MTIERDLDDEMRRFPLDDHTADRILSGAVAPDDAPPDLAPVAQAVRDARGPAAEWELAHRTQIVAAVLAAVEANPGPRPLPTRRRPMLIRFFSAKVALAAVSGVLATTGVAAAGGSLPDPAQSFAASTLDHIGISIPHPSDHHPDDARHHHHALCRAVATGGSGAEHRHARQELAEAAGRAGQSVEEFCRDAQPATVIHEGDDSTGADTTSGVPPVTEAPQHDESGDDPSTPDPRDEPAHEPEPTHYPEPTPQHESTPQHETSVTPVDSTPEHETTAVPEHETAPEHEVSSVPQHEADAAAEPVAAEHTTAAEATQPEGAGSHTSPQTEAQPSPNHEGSEPAHHS